MAQPLRVAPPHPQAGAAPAHQVVRLGLAHADVWIAHDGRDDTAYAYGGTRTLPPATSDAAALGMLGRLLADESRFKNCLVDAALRAGALGPLAEHAPAGFAASSVGGARCIIRPRTSAAAAALADPAAPAFHAAAEPLFAAIGAALNRLEGRVLLTPDFGRFAGLADLLARWTPHVLGVACERGGCGGKSSYSATGVLAALDTVRVPRGAPVTMIGAAGAMGGHVLAGLFARGFAEVAVCDIAYDEGAATPPPGVTLLPATPGAFTEACLSRGGLVVATTVGHELERSPWQIIPPGTTLALAHNLALPAGVAGPRLARQLAARGILVLPGQLLTLGGALTARLEFFWRRAYPGRPFDKTLAHTVVATIVSWLTGRVLAADAAPLPTLRHIAGLTG